MYFNFFSFIFFSYVVFLLGLLGFFFVQKNLILFLILIEILYLAINLNFIFSSFFMDDSLGYIFTLFSIALAGSEISIGLALLIIFYRIQNLNLLNSFFTLKS
jgi:NADH:ubiquinone oxidoreductase subunit K